MARRGNRARARGLTLVEVLVAIAVLAMIAVLIYSAFSAITRGKNNASNYAERYRLARIATSRMSRELAAAYLSAHIAPTPALVTRTTAFLGAARRVDFNAFAHRRVVKDAHESDQCELSYFVGNDPKKPGQLDLLRREQAIPDDQPGKGGVVQILVDDIDTFDLKYLDPLSGLWTDTWDSTSAAAQLGRMPMQVEITLIMKGGAGGSPIRMRTKTPIMIPQPLAFALK
jgi:general secretion pathway protein J